MKQAQKNMNKRFKLIFDFYSTLSIFVVGPVAIISILVIVSFKTLDPAIIVVNETAEKIIVGHSRDPETLVSNSDLTVSTIAPYSRYSFVPGGEGGYQIWVSVFENRKYFCEMSDDSCMTSGWTIDQPANLVVRNTDSTTKLELVKQK